VLAQRAFGLNVAGLVGHTPLRMCVMGGAAWERPASGRERERMAGLLRECLAAGAFGLSTSLFDADASGRPVPSRLAGDAEFAALLDTLAGTRAVLSFIPDVASHAATLAGVQRMAALCTPRGVTVAAFSAPDAPEHVRQALEHGAEIAYGDDGDQACTRLLATIKRIAGLLSLPFDHDSELLAALVTAGPGRDIVLSADGEASYRRFAVRANQIWQSGDPLHLWQC
jgi:hypothetical protein